MRAVQFCLRERLQANADEKTEKQKLLGDKATSEPAEKFQEEKPVLIIAHIGL